MSYEDMTDQEESELDKAYEEADNIFLTFDPDLRKTKYIISQTSNKQFGEAIIAIKEHFHSHKPYPSGKNTLLTQCFGPLRPEVYTLVEIHFTTYTRKYYLSYKQTQTKKLTEDDEECEVFP